MNQSYSLADRGAKAGSLQQRLEMRWDLTRLAAELVVAVQAGEGLPWDICTVRMYTLVLKSLLYHISF